MDAIKTLNDVEKYVDTLFGSVDKNRMIARLVDNQGVDAWMTFELMEAAIRNVVDSEAFHGAGVELRDNMCRDNATSTTASAEHLHLENTDVDKYYNFQSIRVDRLTGKAMIRHQNRADGMFNLKLPQNEMVIFYEGDAHDKDAGKTEKKGCKNAHKMYQYIAQAQSKDIRTSGCAVFAAMKDSPIEDLVQIMEDMLKAHMFACMLIIQHNMCQNKTTKTILEDLLSLDTKLNKKYDFVIGINIKSTSANAKFSTENFDGRVVDMLAALKQSDVAIELIQFGDQAQLQTWDYYVGSIYITCFGVPRAKDDIMKRSHLDRIPAFIYPYHLTNRTLWSNDTGTMTTDPGFWLLDIHKKTAPNSSMELHFHKNMMNVTRVLTTPNARAVKNTCVLAETTGFFYCALPIAYFTVEQFECLVNARMDYRWAPKRFDVKQMLDTFVNKMKGIKPVKVHVKMFMTNQHSLLQTICKRTDKGVEDITDEFKGFLRDCCRWDDADCEGYAYPAIFFRTLGILSLPTAIDFACECRNNPSATYTTLLSTYPIGTQIVIKECMKKLSTNEAYGYLTREKTDLKIVKVEEQGPSDEDEDFSNETIVQTINRNLKNAMTFETKTWTVQHKKSTDEGYDTWLVKIQQDSTSKTLQKKLIEEYKKSKKLWSMKKNQFPEGEVINADRGQQSIFIEEIRNIELKDDEIRDVEVNVKVDKYDIQIKVDNTDPSTPTVYFKPVWPTKFTFKYNKDEYLFPSDIYAQFDDDTILHFESQRNGWSNIAKILLNPVSKSSPKKVTFSSDTASLSDTNDIDL
jgi:hypothetical protein